MSRLRLSTMMSLAGHLARRSDISSPGPASAANRYLAAGLVDELDLIAPPILGRGELPWARPGSDTTRPEWIRAIDASGPTHITYRLS